MKIKQDLSGLSDISGMVPERVKRKVAGVVIGDSYTGS